VGRQVRYFATDAEAAAVTDDAGAAWVATIVRVNRDGSVNLLVQRGNGTTLAKTSVTQTDRKGGYAFRGVLAT
jgi:hypothetical protein